MKAKKTGVIIGLILLLIVAAGGYVGGVYYIDNKCPNFTEDYVLYVYPDTDVGFVAGWSRCHKGRKSPEVFRQA